MFKNILTVALVSSLSVAAFAQKSGRVIELDRSKRESVNKDKTGLVKSTAAEKAQVEKVLGTSELSNVLKGLPEALSRLSVETANVLTIDSIKAAEAVKLAKASVFQDALGQKALASALQTLAYTKGVRPAAEIIELAEMYKGSEAFEIWVTVEREIARASKNGSYEPVLQGLTAARSILRGGSADVDFNKLIEAEKSAIRDLEKELRSSKNRCLIKSA